MRVLKRDGRKEAVKFDKITARIEKLCYGLSEYVDPVAVAKRVVDGVYDGVTTSELDNLAAETAASMTIKHPDYANLAARIAVSNLHKSTKKSFSETVTDLYEYINPETGKKAPLGTACRRAVQYPGAGRNGATHHVWLDDKSRQRWRVELLIHVCAREIGEGL